MSSGERKRRSPNQSDLGFWTAMRKGPWEGKRIERRATEGESPVPEPRHRKRRFRSRTGHEKPCPKTRGPPRKAKYDPATDSEPVP